MKLGGKTKVYHEPKLPLNSEANPTCLAQDILHFRSIATAVCSLWVPFCLFWNVGSLPQKIDNVCHKLHDEERGSYKRAAEGYISAQRQGLQSKSEDDLFSISRQ